jgi:hypothetical protein
MQDDDVKVQSNGNFLEIMTLVRYHIQGCYLFLELGLDGSAYSWIAERFSTKGTPAP